MTDERLLKKLISHIAAGALEPCRCGCAAVTIIPTSEKTTMPHFACDGCGRGYAFNGFLILRCVQKEHIIEIGSETSDLTALEVIEKRRLLDHLLKDF